MIWFLVAVVAWCIPGLIFRWYMRDDPKFGAPMHPINWALFLALFPIAAIMFIWVTRKS